MFGWLKNRRRRELLGRPFPDDWRKWLEQNVALYRRLPEGLRARLHDLVKVFVAEKHWEGCGGLTLTDEIRVTIAGHACLMVAGIEPNYYFDRVESILVYPNAYLLPQRAHAGGWLVEEDTEMLGEYHHHGPLVLSWADVLKEGRSLADGRNLVLHEFSHHLDGLEGEMDGTPPLGSRQEYRSWEHITDAEYRRLVHMADRGRPTLLDSYGAESKAEFFAVATECFFEKPAELLRRHPALYEVLRRFYRMDPAEWAAA
jgi:Mlc titration factor MtfA (ptsG expression regulator)